MRTLLDLDLNFYILIQTVYSNVCDEELCHNETKAEFLIEESISEYMS